MSSGSLSLFRGQHPSGHATTLPMPTWFRPDASPVRHLPPAPFPGAHTAEVLAETVHTDEEIEGSRKRGSPETGGGSCRSAFLGDGAQGGPGAAPGSA